PVLAAEGRVHPVETRYSPPPAGQTRPGEHQRREILRLLREETGSLLVVLPGEGEIRRLADDLAPALPADVLLCPLYGQLGA
ncbi:hypothetical protein ABTC13_19975, partial [Acinetobacter baumannii]